MFQAFVIYLLAMFQAFVNEEREGSSMAMTNELQRLRNELAAMRANMRTKQHEPSNSSHSVQSSVHSR